MDIDQDDDEKKTKSGLKRESSDADLEMELARPAAKESRLKERSSSSQLPAQFVPEDPNPANSFESLLRQFANMGIKDAPAESDCPVCQAKVPLADFANHVFKCTEKFDEEDQLASDEAYARQLEQNELDDVPVCRYGAKCHSQDPQHFLAYSHPEPEKKKCGLGAACTALDPQHYVSFTHPTVNCPICNEEQNLFELNAHLGFCLEKPPPLDPPLDGTDAPMAMAVEKKDLGPAPAPSEPRKSQLPSFSQYRDKHEDDSQAAVERPSLVPDDDSKAPTLSDSQLSACAAFVLNERAKESKGEHSEFSIGTLLKRFKKLGLTAQTMTRALSRTGDGMSSSSSSSSASLSSSPPASSPPSSSTTATK